MLTLTQASARFQIPARTIQALCGFGLVAGAQLNGEQWELPDCAAIDPPLLEKFLHHLQEAERALAFPAFPAESAWTLGEAIIGLAKKRGFSVSTEIWMNRRMLFRYAMEGTNPQNDRWLCRKRNTVELVHMSTLRAELELLCRGETLDGTWLLDPHRYTDFGGGFPLTLAHSGVVGAICVSGAPHEQDHLLAADGIRLLLDKAN